MRFLRNGPDIPSKLLNEHEDHRVAFFAGAGISRPAGLRDFGGLVTALFDTLNETPNAVQEDAIKTHKYDTAIALLEGTVTDGRTIVRRHLVDLLTPDPEVDEETATSSHDALLTLAKTRLGRTHLVTTNFDRLFEQAISRRPLGVHTDAAPHLPVPKTRWDSVVYLHGLLPEEPTGSDLERLVLSSGDFGIAYLTERWAARFASELFRNYTVCFVGYSIDDPIMRYMLDALAAERQLGESPREMFAFADYHDDPTRVRAEWEARNVTPILYAVDGADDEDHTHLHQTLRQWADIYRDGIGGKKTIVVADAHSRPLESTVEDDSVGRMIWALGDPSGVPAAVFAALDPPPPLDWLDVFCKGENSDLDLRPLRTRLESAAQPLGSRASYLLGWLIRYLGEPSLFLWFGEGSDKPHPMCSYRITAHLDRIDELEADGNTAELEELRISSPQAIPRPVLKVLWRLLLQGRVTSRRPRGGSRDLTPWLNRVERHGLTTPLRLELRDLLTPRLLVRKPWVPWEDIDSEYRPEGVARLFDCEVTLGIGNAHDEAQHIAAALSELDILSDLLDDLSVLLADAHALMRAIGIAGVETDNSFMSQPSIGSHGQNRGVRGWTALIELVRDAWLATLKQNPVQAKRVAEGWEATPYPLYRRLSFFAATNSELIEPAKGLDWLLADDCRWLWSRETQREAIRLLVKLGGELDSAGTETLQAAILRGPPASDENGDDGVNNEQRDPAVWFRLAKLASVGHALTPEADAVYRRLSARYPVWQVAQDESDEFPTWMGDVRMGSWEEGGEGQKKSVLPRDPDELLSWIRDPSAREEDAADDWQELCRDDLELAAATLEALAGEDHWPVVRWRVALQVWSDEALSSPSWVRVSPFLSSAPGTTIAELARQLSRWLRGISKTLDTNEERFLALCRRTLEQSTTSDEIEDDDGDPVFYALNHPEGHVVEALVRWWTRSPLQDDQGLPDELGSILTTVCDTTHDGLRHGRVWLAANAVLLFRVDRLWAIEYLLPLFDWQQSEVEARAAWAGFLWAPRLYPPLLESLKRPFVETASHYDQLGDYGRRYAHFLTFVALNRGDALEASELRAATGALPEEGFVSASHFLLNTLEAAEGQSVDVWKNRIGPYFESIWPTSYRLRNRHVSRALARMCIGVDAEFPNALGSLRPWLGPLETDYGVSSQLNETGLAKTFPAEALEFLAHLIDEHTHISEALTTCLRDISETAPELVEHHDFLRLRDFVRARGWDVEWSEPSNLGSESL